MFVMDCLSVNEKGHLTIGGCDTIQLAKEYGTPLYVLDETTIRNACRAYKRSFEKHYAGKGLPFYASKALNCKAICRIIMEEGLGLDVVSGGELYTALQAGFPANKIHMHGNNKTPAELRMALDAGVGRIVLDNLFEMETLNQMAGNLGKKVAVSMRVKPGIDAHTHEFIRTGQIDSKFGFALETGEALQAVKQVLAAENLTLKELHCHIGSQIFEIEPFVQAAKVMMDFMAEIRKETGLAIESLNLGGGFGIHYLTSDQPQPYDRYMEAVSLAIREKAAEHDVPMPFICIEPGRSIVGEAGITLYEIGGIKEIPNVRNYVSIDGGMTDNPRFALYQSAYTVLIADKAGQRADYQATIAGKCCESGDLIQKDTMIQTPEVGDILAVLSTGAYNYSMASNYNRIPRPAIVLVRGREARLAVRRESYEDLIRNDL